MNTLRQAVQDYLDLRRSLGFKLKALILFRVLSPNGAQGNRVGSTWAVHVQGIALGTGAGTLPALR